MNEWDAYYKFVSEHNDVEYDSVETIEVSSAIEKWVGGVNYDGNVFGITNSAQGFLFFNGMTGSYEIFGPPMDGRFKWTGGALYNNKIYGFLRTSNLLLVIDPINMKQSVMELGLDYSEEHHYGGVMTNKGIIYQPPRNTDHILKIDVNNRTAKKISIGEFGRYSASIQDLSGLIWFLPELRGKIILLDSLTDEIKYIGEPFSDKVFGAVIGFDRNIYGFSETGNGLLKICTLDQKVTWICEEAKDIKAYGTMVGVNGKLYSVPGNGDSVWEYDIVTEKCKKKFTIGEGRAKCAGAGMARDGSIIMIPAFGNYIYKVNTSTKEMLDNVFLHNRFINNSY
ncbi:MAG: hypothetical protein IJ535_00015 [Pseudobutyrivibrio sp.]|uniref:hypothetical protein n=1 Tax=Pseudobutyrivibrio sp. TaxID=2014367 RepID=UPI0025E14739|nr:hypothetical protein [Pseudobutyrivibrio sp.]MBQ8488143.1 hypothetical protein [Pseudobutyrivibrio sp.]